MASPLRARASMKGLRLRGGEEDGSDEEEREEDRLKSLPYRSTAEEVCVSNLSEL